MRLITLVGPGGVGKTRLALEVAATLGEEFAGGAWYVELAGIGDPALVSMAVATALDLRESPANPSSRPSAASCVSERSCCYWTTAST